MKIKGKVTGGMGKAKYFLSKDYYTNEFNKKCGFKPYPGTLNLITDAEYSDEIIQIKNDCNNIINENNSFGAVKYIESTLNGKYKGAIIFPLKTTHNANHLEFICKDKLRDLLNLKDGDEVLLELLI